MAVPSVTHTFTASTRARSAQVNTNFTNVISALTAGTADVTFLTVNNLTITSSTGVLSIAAAKTLTMSNTLTFTGTDASTVSCGAGGTVIYASNKLSALSATTSAELATVISNESGTGLLVFNDTPTLITPLLGTPTSGVLTSCTGLPLTTGITGTLGAANGGTGVANNAASTITISGNFATTLTVSNTTGVTLPVSGTLATLAGSEALTSKTYNGLTITSSTGTLTIAAAKVLTCSNTLTFTGTDTSSVAFGAGGTVIYNGGALGTPASGVATNLTGTASGLTAGTASAVAVGGITGLGTGVGTWLATPSSANLASAVTDETGTGALVFGTSPSITTPTITGITSGSAFAAGKVGEVLTASSSSIFDQNPATLGTWYDVTSVSISCTAGFWIIFAQGLGQAIVTSGSTSAFLVAAIRDGSANIIQGNAFGFISSAVSANDWGNLSLVAYANISGTTTYKLSIMASAYAGTPTVELLARGDIYATRITAIRLA